MLKIEKGQPAFAYPHKGAITFTLVVNPVANVFLACQVGACTFGNW